MLSFKDDIKKTHFYILRIWGEYCVNEFYQIDLINSVMKQHWHLCVQGCSRGGWGKCSRALPHTVRCVRQAATSILGGPLEMQALSTILDSTNQNLHLIIIPRLFLSTLNLRSTPQDNLPWFFPPHGQVPVPILPGLS